MHARRQELLTGGPKWEQIISFRQRPYRQDGRAMYCPRTGQVGTPCHDYHFAVLVAFVPVAHTTPVPQEPIQDAVQLVRCRVLYEAGAVPGRAPRGDLHADP
jgi:hypothetical protein